MTEVVREPGAVLPPEHLSWQAATVLGIRVETARAKTFRLGLANRTPGRAGQHYVVRLTAPDGYSAQRSYSVASAPDDTAEIELTVERLEGGEVSSFLHDEVVVGDEIEVRGPIGGWFAWDATTPALLIGGGSGVVPLMAMLRLARRSGASDLVDLVVSVRTPGDLLFQDELVGPEVRVAYTRQAPPESDRPIGRLGAADLDGLVPGSGSDPDVDHSGVSADLTAFVCGSAGFADAATELLIGAGLPVEQIRVERFGPTG